jgi:predicted ribosomally synthesized peptide with nif11-like leader
MSQAHVEQFANRIKNDPAMFNKLVAGTETPEQFIEKAIALGKESGFTFTKEEADGWVEQQIKAKQNGELSDLQLEGVAGGKGGAVGQIGSGIGQVVGGVGGVITGVVGGVTNTIQHWFSSW